MAAATITVTVLVVLLIVAIAALLMKINKDSKRMDALGSESLVKRMANPPVERPAVMRPADRIESAVMPPPPRMARPAVMRPAVMPPPSSMIRPAVMPRRPEDNMRVGSLTLQKAKAAAEAAAAKETPPNAAKGPQAPVDDIENIGDQSLMLDEDPSQEYDEMAEETGIAKIAIPQPDENWIKSRQVQPVKDLSVGIAITNDVSKQDNLQAGKITSKFPIRARPTVMPSMPHHKGPQGTPAYFEAMRAAAAKAAQERDAKARSMVDKRARSMAENAEMQALKRIDNSGMKQYDMTKGPPRAMIGVMKPTRPTRLPQKRPCSDFGNGYRDDGMGCWLGDEMVVSLSERTGTTDAFVTIAKMKADKREREELIKRNEAIMASRAAAITAVKMEAKMKAEEAANKAAMKVAKMQAEEAANKAAMKAAKMQAAGAANKAAMQAAEAAEYAEHQRKQKAAMKAAKMQAEEAANKAVMKVAKMEATEAANKTATKVANMQANEAANKAAMKAAKMQAEEAANKAAMKVEGYEMMKPWGSMVY